MSLVNALTSQSDPLKTLRSGTFNTDKSQDYLNHYENFFNPLKNKKITLLELGVFEGGSLNLWQNYFTSGTIVGIDICDKKLDLHPNIVFKVGDQTDTAFLTSIAQDYADGEFDIIIDDASHVGRLSQVSFLHLFRNHLKSNGIYVIEDWGTGYWKDWPDGTTATLTATHTSTLLDKESFPAINNSLLQKPFASSHSSGMVGFVKELIDEIGIQDLRKGKAHSRSSMFSSVTYDPGQVFVTKK